MFQNFERRGDAQFLLRKKAIYDDV